MTDYVQQWKSLTFADLKKSPVYTRLTKQAKIEAGKTKEEVIQFLETKIFPLKSASLSDFVYSEWLRYMQYRSSTMRLAAFIEVNETIASSAFDACVKKVCMERHKLPI